jgi:pyridoxine 4-dehydrogenase
VTPDQLSAARTIVDIAAVTAHFTWSPAIMPVPGTTSIGHLQENLDAQDITLTTEDIDAINGIADENTQPGLAGARQPTATT